MNRKLFRSWCEHHIRKTVKLLACMGRTAVLLLGVILVLGCVLGWIIGGGIQKMKADKKVKEVTAKVQKEEADKLQQVQKELFDLKEELHRSNEDRPWNLVLVNGDHPMQTGYTPKLTEFREGYKVDTRIAEAADKMLKDAEAAGMKIMICSAYRSVERQAQVFSESMKERVRDGMDYWEAYHETAKNVAEPGTSEHALGLALDLISDQYAELDERQESTKEAKWLAENCHKYGFILRYPPEKTAITGIIYEPWHYRYVGVEDATKIMDLGITLEEYLQDHYQAEEGK